MNAPSKRTAPPGLEGLDLEALEAAKEAARDFGLTLEQWVAATSPGDVHRPVEAGNRTENSPPKQAPKRAPASRPAGNELDTAIEKLNGVAQLARRRASTAAEGLEAALATAAQREGRAQEQASTFAGPVASRPTGRGREDDRARWTPPAAADGTERRLADTMAMIAHRLEEIERKMQAGGEPSIDVALKAAVERIEHRLEKTNDHQDHPDTNQIEIVLRGFEERIAQIADRVGGRRAPGQRVPQSAEELASAVSEIRARQMELEKPQASFRSAGSRDGADAYREILHAVRGDIAELARRMETLRSGETTHSDISAVRGDIERLELVIGGLATRDEVMGAVARPAVDPSTENLLSDTRQALTEFSRQQSHMGDFARRLDATARELEDLGSDGPNSALAALAQEVAALGARVERSGTLPADDLAQRIEGLSLKLDRLSEKPRISVSSSAEGIETLFQRLDQLEARLADRSVPELKPIEHLLQSLVEKIDLVERSDGNGEGLDALEKQVAAIVGRLEQVSADPAISSLERTMSDLMGQIELLRVGTTETASAAAKAAVAETLAALPMAAGTPDFSSFKRELDDLKSQQSVVDNRVQATLENVHAALETMVARLGVLEDEAAAGGPERLQSERAPRTTRVKAPAPAPQAERPTLAGKSLTGDDQDEGARHLLQGSEEILLEPGAGRPRQDASAQPADAAPDAASDIKASFIAAARRAAQAAADEAASNRRRAVGAADPLMLARAEGARASLAARMKAGLDKHRRPILLGLAAIVLALGAIQAIGIGRDSTQDTGEGSMASIAPAPGGTAPLIDAPTPPREARAADQGPTEPTAKDAEPRTTQAITLASSSAGEASLPSPEPARREDNPAAKPATTALVAPPPETAKAGLAKAEGPAALAAPTATKAPLQISTAAPVVDGAGEGTAPAVERLAKIASVGELPVSPDLPGLRQAALKGDPIAVYEMASRLVEGRGFSRDPQLAAKLFEKAATAGLVPAQYRIGNHYEKGLGVPRDIALARSWYQRAADAGNARAMHNLAVIIAQGADGKPDYAAAADWFRRAAEHGIKDSQFNLAVLMARGLGVPQQFAQSYTWFAIAAGQGDQDAAKKRDEIAGKLSAADLSGAKATAEKFRPVMPDQAKNEVALPAQGWADATPAQPAQRAIQRPGKRV